jgi:hypothetical protein
MVGKIYIKLKEQEVGGALPKGEISLLHFCLAGVIPFGGAPLTSCF